MKSVPPRDLSAFSLHLIAMAAMLCDHLWASIVPGNDWLTWVGRAAYPLFAFLIAQGYRHTGSFRRYLGRLSLCALISELPFNLLYSGSWVFPFQQNVIWGFLLALLCMKALDRLQKNLTPWLAWPLMALTAALFALSATMLMVNYGGYGLLMAVVFYLFPGDAPWQWLGQLAGLYLINWQLMGSLQYPVHLPGMTWQIPQQGAALLSLIPIWLYRGRQGPHGKWIRLLFYGFFPVHMLVLGLLQ